MSLSVRLQILGLFFLRSLSCHSSRRYHQPIEILSISYVALLSLVRIVGRSTINYLTASFEVVNDGVSFFFRHLFRLSGLDEHFVNVCDFVT